MRWTILLKLVHVLSAMLLVGGMLGRGLAFAQARRATELPTAHALLGLSERFERLMVRPGSEVVLLFGLLTAWREGQPLFGVLQGSPINWLLVALVLYLSTIPLVFLVLLPRSRRRARAAEAALAFGSITPDLRQALDDRVVGLARNLELAIILVVVVLMVTKPF